ncbi:DUF5658 family protein [Anaerobacillus sp. 1_MG-2023]|uniref:DUF5658 family protein n=1 Tax=Bacillales TaxID=1385 RepID=UPI0034E01582
MNRKCTMNLGRLYKTKIFHLIMNKGTKWEKFFVIYLACINTLDGFITYWGIQNGWIGEVNPLMRALFQMDPLVFLMYKIGLSIFLIVLLLKFHHLKSVLIRILLIVASTIYSFILCIHGYWVYILLPK